jgi:hypothetical protein
MQKRNFQAVFLGIKLFLLFVAFPVVSEAQDQKGSFARIGEQTEQSCSKSGVCVAEDRYTATVTDVLPNESPNSLRVRLIVRFENISDAPLILAYRAHSASLLDDFKNRFYCCTGDSAPDLNAIGIGTDAGAKVDPQLVLQPHDQANVIFELWRRRDNLQASYYDFDVMIDEIDPVHKYRVLRNPNLSFRDLVPRARLQRQSLSVEKPKALVFHHCVCFNLDQPIWINEAHHLHDCVRGANFTKELAMYQRDLFPVFNASEQNSRTRDIREFPA